MKEYLRQLPHRYFITAFTGMAQGLFVTLIAGTILGQVAAFLPDSTFTTFLATIALLAKSLMGAGIGIGIAHALGHNKLVMLAAGPAGLIGAFTGSFFESLAGTFPVGEDGALMLSLGSPGNPIGAYVVTMFVVEILGLYAGKTSLDIILVPLGGLLFSGIGIFIAYPFVWIVNQLGWLIAKATDASPLPMGIIIAVSIGLLLTMPTSSAATWVSVSMPILGVGAVASQADQNAMLLASGAAAVGCASQMIGFAVSSYRENGFGGFIAQGFGTSMLQIPNIMRKPIILVPMTVASAVGGALSTTVFKVQASSAGGGMGTSGLVGVIDAFTHTSGTLGMVGIIVLMFILPAVLSLAISEFMRIRGWIKLGDMKLPD
ncbi:MAG: PTS sugar transporter subunit IIC [Actinomycetaceae bacterium]|nr:PTS sugar transporter subunit IIC [Actinomycetaceae bacterium]